MAAHGIAALRLGDEAAPIEIKFIRSWVSFGARGECCFLMVDKYGGGIQATASLTDRTYFQNLLRVGSYYRLTNYICESGRTYMRFVPHGTGIRIGKAAGLQHIPDHDFPEYYFNFVQYDELKARDGETTILTDYIGKVEHVGTPFKQEKVNIMKMKLEDMSGNIVNATFWGQLGRSLDKAGLAALPPPVIVAVTSMKVTSYL